MRSVSDDDAASVQVSALATTSGQDGQLVSPLEQCVNRHVALLSRKLKSITISTMAVFKAYSLNRSLCNALIVPRIRTRTRNHHGNLPSPCLSLEVQNQAGAMVLARMTVLNLYPKPMSKLILSLREGQCSTTTPSWSPALFLDP
jgi:hypothetical protein